MTWTAAAFAILLAALAGGYAWYERAQPTDGLRSRRCRTSSRRPTSSS
jgi:hypothetical protein